MMNNLLYEIGANTGVNTVMHIACEDYSVYAWEADNHKWSGLHTPKLIGIIMACADIEDIELQLRMAVIAKDFVTDDKLKAWGLWKKGERHSRDALRHALYHQIFG